MKRFLLFLPLVGLAFAGTEVTLKTSTGALNGTLEIPATAEKSCVVLILAGSGPTDRDGNSLGLSGKNDSLKLVATALAKAGIPSLRGDKRGVAASKAAGPNEEDLRFDSYVDDTVAWIDFLQSVRGYQKVIILGHSEGGLIGLVAAAQKPVAGYISVAGSSRRASVVLREQLATQLPPKLRTEANVILQQLDQGVLVNKFSAALDPVFRKSVQPYLISWFHYTPTEEIARLTCPILIIQGTTDIQVSTTDADALQSASPGSSLVKIDGMNHVLKEVPTDEKSQLASYADPELPLAPGLMAPIEAFIRKIADASQP